MKFIGREKQLEQLNNAIKRTVNKQMMQQFYCMVEEELVRVS